MGRIKDLRKKVEEGVATEAEKEELETLEDEAKEDEAPKEEAPETEETGDKSVDYLLGKFVKKLDSFYGDKKEKEKIVETTELKKETDLTPEERTKQFIQALIANDKARMKVLSEGTNADGGYLVPEYWFMQIVEEIRDASVIRPLATVIANCPKQLNITQLSARPKVAFRAEKAVKDTSTATFDQIALTPYSLACIVVLTKELVEDSEVGGNIITLITRLISEAIAEREDKAFAIGNGTTQPTGIDNYNATVGRIVATPANVLTADSLIEAFYRLGQGYRRNAVWLMTSKTLTVARQLKDSQNRYLFIPDPTASIVGTILGRPVYEQNDLPNNRIWLGDVKGYWIGDRGGISVDQSEEAWITGVGSLFEQNEVAIRVEKRVDGEMADLNAFVVITGTN